MAKQKQMLYGKFGREHAGRDCADYEKKPRREGCCHVGECVGFVSEKYVVKHISMYRISPSIGIPSFTRVCFGCKINPDEYPKPCLNGESES